MANDNIYSKIHNIIFNNFDNPNNNLLELDKKKSGYMNDYDKNALGKPSKAKDYMKKIGLNMHDLKIDEDYLKSGNRDKKEFEYKFGKGDKKDLKSAKFITAKYAYKNRSDNEYFDNLESAIIGDEEYKENYYTNAPGDDVEDPDKLNQKKKVIDSRYKKGGNNSEFMINKSSDYPLFEKE